MTSTVRAPAVAGRFYPRDRQELLDEVHAFSVEEATPRPAIGCIAPHAGYVYSGHVAGALYSSISIPKRCVILCPNHTGVGHPLAILSQAEWDTPLGRVRPDLELANELLDRVQSLQEDASAHRSEHAIEVQLPFLQVRQPEMKIVPIAIGTSKYDRLEELGQALAELIDNSVAGTLIIASSDMNHYESDTATRMKDGKAIERILALDAFGLWDVVMRDKISMCGFGPAVAMLTAARQLGAQAARMVKYATSGDVSGDREMVVGYAGIVVT